MKKLIAGLVAAVAMTASAGAANAVTYVLNLTNAQSALPAPYGTVDVTQGGANTLNFSVNLFDGLRFVDTGAHYVFSFSLDNVSGVSLTPQTGLTLVTDPGNIPNSPFSGFDYGIACSVSLCGNGANSPLSGPLNFSITGTGLTLANIGTADSYNGQVVRFAADTASQAGVTGTIGGGTAVPEPATWAMMIVGFGMVGAGLRRRRTAALAA